MTNSAVSDSPPTLVLASRNAKKVREMEELLRPHGIRVLCAADFPEVPEVDEDGTTFAENAAKKARETARATAHWAIGEDSGLCVDALQGAPGIYSARFSGPQATDESNNALLLERLHDIPDSQRTAHYVSHLALADPTGEIRLAVERTCHGLITRIPRGTHGFGYDPYFLIREYHQTFGELPPIIKQTLSHRARAFQSALPQLVQLIKD